MNTKFHVSKDPCISCNAHQFFQFYKATKKVTLLNNRELIFQQNLECCHNCGLVRQENNKTYSDTNLEIYYAQTFRTPGHPGIITKEDKRVKNARKRLLFISKLKGKGALLEVGFGDGAFLNLAATKFLCTGLDSSVGYRYLHDYLIKRNIEILKTSFEEYSSKRKFDIICSFLVLEHIKDPLSFIKRQIKHLSPGGILVIEVPDIRRYATFNSESVLTFEHVYHYSIESLSFLLSHLNLELIATRNKDVSYGFSLIAAFKLNRKNKGKILNSSFQVMEIFQEFIEKRKQYQQQMTSVINDVISKAHSKNQAIALYGAGFLFNYAVECCDLDMNKAEFLFDDTKEKLGKVFFGKTIRPISELKKYKPGVVIVFSEMFFEAMKQNILRFAGNESINIINIHKLSIEKYN